MLYCCPTNLQPGSTFLPGKPCFSAAAPCIGTPAASQTGLIVIEMNERATFVHTELKLVWMWSSVLLNWVSVHPAVTMSFENLHPKCQFFECCCDALSLSSDTQVGNRICYLNLPYLLLIPSEVIKKASGWPWIMKTDAWTTDKTWTQAGNWSILAWRHGWVCLMLKEPKHSVTSGYIADVSKCIGWCSTSNSPDNMHVIHLITPRL